MSMQATHVMSFAPVSEDISVRLLRGTKGLESIRGIWAELTSQAEPMGFYNQYAWYENYLNYLDHDPESMIFVLASRGSSAVAILPLKCVPASRPVGLRRLQLPHHDHLGLADAVVRRGEDYPWIMKCIVRKLAMQKEKKWDMLLFPEIFSGSSIDRAFRKGAGLSIVRETSHGSHFIPNAGGYEATAARLSGNFRRDLRRKFKRAGTLGELSYRSVESPAEIEEAFREFLAVEASGWKGQEGTASAISCNSQLEGFYHGLTQARTPWSHCVINLLYLNDICIAGEFCLYCNGVLSLLKIGYLEQEEYSRVSPGSLLFDKVLRDWCERPNIRAISLVGDAPWQHSWHPDTQEVFRYRIYNRTIRAFPAWMWRAWLRPYVKRLWMVSAMPLRAWWGRSGILSGRSTG